MLISMTHMGKNPAYMTSTNPKTGAFAKAWALLCSLNKTFTSMKEVVYDTSLAESNACKRPQQQ